jgi:hypothetical protein
MKARPFFVAALVAVLPVASACGDDDDDGAASSETTAAESTETTAAEPSAKDEYVAAADEICAKLNADQEGIGAGLSQESSPQEIQAALQQLLDLSKAALADVRALPIPAGDEDEVEPLLDELGRLLGEAGERISTPEGAMAEISREDDAFAGLNEKFRNYGMVECGRE